MSTTLTLVIGNKNYSSWSMRPWVLLKHFQIPFTEKMLKFETTDWVKNIAQYSPSGKVPVLWEGEPGTGLAVWDTLAIFEHVAELFPHLSIWPTDAAARATARSICAEMHSSFQGVRSAMPMNVRGSYPGQGHTDKALSDIKRIVEIWQICRTKFGHVSSKAFLFGDFSAADAMFAPVVMRFKTYGVVLPKDLQSYCAAVETSPGVVEWNKEALLETDFIAADEPYANR
jgi:glutathione S-transferase